MPAMQERERRVRPVPKIKKRKKNLGAQGLEGLTVILERELIRTGVNRHPWDEDDFYASLRLSVPQTLDYLDGGIALHVGNEESSMEMLEAVAQHYYIDADDLLRLRQAGKSATGEIVGTNGQPLRRRHSLRFLSPHDC
jgi:hypothetical protein